MIYGMYIKTGNTVTMYHVYYCLLLIPVARGHSEWALLKVYIFYSFKFKGAQSYFFNFFSNFLRFWYQKMSHIFLITHGKSYGQKVFTWNDSVENVTKLHYLIMYGELDRVKLESIPFFFFLATYS